MTTIEIGISQAEREAANQIARKMGYTLDGIIQQLVQRILRDNSIPAEWLNAASREKEEERRERAFESIQQWHKYIIGAPLTHEDIISARDEGRRN